MKNISFPICLFLILLTGCKKEISHLPVSETKPVTGTSGFLKYIIYKGQQYCDQNTFKPVACSELKFTVKFDSTAIYTSENPANQYDINKLYGFSDNNSDHLKFSTRFGWRWSSGALRLFGYTYNNAVRSSKELGTVIIGAENFCSIKVEAGNYIFTLNGKADTMQRKSTALQAIGYRLYPYFGGDEIAPHDINIWIKELP
ncbi:MAG: hypothetical protein ABIO81_10470 [Ginsengibacter sp.]